MNIENIRKIRQYNFTYLATKYESRAEYAKKLGYQDANYINQLVNGHTGIGNQTAKKIETVEGLEKGWLSIPHHDLWEGIQATTKLDTSNLANLSNRELAEILDEISSILKSRDLNL